MLIGCQPDLPHKPYPGYYDLPGGKLEPGESTLACLLREVKEETGFDVGGYEWEKSYHHFGNDPRCSNDLPGVGICFKVTVISGEFKPTEMDEMQWATPEELRSLVLTPWAKHFLADFLAKRYT